MYHQYQLYSLHGQSKDALAKTKVGAWEYDIIGPWYKCNMTGIMAAIGLKQFDRYEGFPHYYRKQELPVVVTLLDGSESVRLTGPEQTGGCDHL